MRVVLDISERDMRDVIGDINDNRRQDGNLDKLTLAQVKAKLKDQEYLKGVADELLASTIEILA